MLYLATTMNKPLTFSIKKPSWASWSLIANIMVFAFPLIVYLALPNKNYGWDAAEYIIRIEHGTLESLFHPHHLLYNPLGYIVTEFLDIIGLTVSTASIMQIMNSIAGAVGVFIFFRILLKFTDQIGLSVVFALLLAFSMAYWEYTIEVEVYIIPMVCLLAILLLIVEYLSGKVKSGSALFLKLGLLTSFACLFHQMHIMLLVVVIVFIMLTVKSNLQRVKMLGVYFTPFVVLVCGSYVAVAQAMGNLKSFSSFWHWLTSYFQTGAWGSWDYTDFPMAGYCLFKTFLARSETRDYLISGSIDEKGIGLLAVLSIAGIIFIILVAFTIFNLKGIYRSHRNLTIILFAWLFSYSIFCLWWDPISHELWMPILPPIWLLIFMAIQRSKMVEKRFRSWQKLISSIPIVLLILLFAVNFASDILPNSDINNNENYHLATKFNSIGLTEEDLVRLRGPVPLNNYYMLFFGSEVQVSSLANRPPEYSDDETDTITEAKWFAYHEMLIEDTLSKSGRVFISENELTPNPRDSRAFLGERSFIKLADYPVFYAKYEDNLAPVFPYMWRSKEIWMFEIEGELSQ